MTAMFTLSLSLSPLTRMARLTVCQTSPLTRRASICTLFSCHLFAPMASTSASTASPVVDVRPEAAGEMQILLFLLFFLHLKNLVKLSIIVLKLTRLHKQTYFYLY